MYMYICIIMYMYNICTYRYVYINIYYMSYKNIYDMYRVI